ncbi:MAG: hypothetical protein EWV50_08495 [Microcystis aeruginosa Ma_MB_F_20061100_S20]|nr:MAG: hypothetical protein EWV50_08495 [Microcystis aeruginosa Ma_MB_F_20061100_S20]
MGEFFKLFPKKVFLGLFVGLMVGLVAWVISSVFLSKILGYGSGALIGQLCGAVGIAFLSYNSSRPQDKYKWMYISSVSMVIFFAAYFGGFTVYLKNLIDNLTHEVTDTNFVLAYMVCFGVLAAIVCGFSESVVELKKL